MPRAPTSVRVVNLRSLVFWGLGAYLAWRIFDAIAIILLLCSLAFLCAMVLDPLIRWLDKHGVSRRFAVGITAITVLICLAVTLFLAIPPIIREGTAFANQLPDQTQRLQGRLEAFTIQYPQLRQQIANANLSQRALSLSQWILPQVGRYSLNLLNGLVSLLLVFILTLYILADPNPLVRGLARLFPKPYKRIFLRVLIRFSAQLQSWAHATFWMMLVIGVLSGIGLWGFGVKNALLFAILAGVGEAIPTIGPILSAIPPFLVVLADDPVKALWILVLFFFIQQFENNVLVPRIMASHLRLHPVSVLLCVMIMGTLLGPVGILLATPLCALIKVIYKEIFSTRINGTDRHKQVTGEPL